MNVLATIGAATSPVLGHVRTAEAAVGARRLVPPFSAMQGTGLPYGGPSPKTLDRTRLPFGGRGVDGAMGADQAKNTVRIPAAADQGIPPRRTPSRC